MRPTTALDDSSTSQLRSIHALVAEQEDSLMMAYNGFGGGIGRAVPAFDPYKLDGILYDRR
jgi:hypothetical protein